MSYILSYFQKDPKKYWNVAIKGRPKLLSTELNLSYFVRYGTCKFINSSKTNYVVFNTLQKWNQNEFLKIIVMYCSTNHWESTTKYRKVRQGWKCHVVQCRTLSAKKSTTTLSSEPQMSYILSYFKWFMLKKVRQHWVLRWGYMYIHMYI